MHDLDHIDLTEIRPRFRLKTSLTKVEVKEKFKQGIKDNVQISGKIVGDHIHLKIPKQHTHFWSPELSIDIDYSNKKQLLRCLVGPNQQVWAMFVFIYGSIILSGLFGAMYGFTQWQLNDNTMWLWIIPIALILFLIAFSAAKVGQKIGHDQMVLLIKTTHRILGKENFEEDNYG